MKNIKYIIGIFLAAAFFVGCEEETYEFGALTAPTNLDLSYTIGGSDVNPLGDATGVVNFNISADNALSLRLVYNGVEKVVPKGKTTMAFSSEEGVAGTNGANLYTVTVVAYGVGGTSSSKTYDFEVIGFVMPPVILEDFEGAEPAFRTFGPDNHPITVIDNPFSTGINKSAKVVEYAKPAGSEGWAGISIPVSGIDLEKYSKFSLKVYSPKDNIDMVLKVETAAGDVDPKFENFATITKKDEWIEVFFDFSEAPVGDYSTVVLFFNTWNSGDGSMYYFDDIKLSK